MQYTIDVFEDQEPYTRHTEDGPVTLFRPFWGVVAEAANGARKWLDDSETYSRDEAEAVAEFYRSLESDWAALSEPRWFRTTSCYGSEAWDWEDVWTMMDDDERYQFAFGR